MHAATGISDSLKNSYEYSLSISFLKKILHLSLSLYCFVSIIFEFIFKVFVPKQVCNKTVMWWCYDHVPSYVIQYSNGEILREFPGDGPQEPIQAARACKAMKYQPRTQAFRSGFVSQLWRKAIKAAKQNPERKKLRDEIRNGKPGFEANETPCLDFLAVYDWSWTAAISIYDCLPFPED